ncbi:macro domain-containing protein [Planktothrix paucivesiculata]|jgi:O-acetyl-ADP-ribose deacetylase (regulator of RNase III)|uniref:Appr-1-p processing protein n=1 Tax=Planktothrix paucivesiculata PCC 9631 TaxID=671071 RepID=A0A7Z9BLG6_9CYAN|nr:macro domain-containing protein [Planktothrix paucivesiculata]VXD17080.1 Appr-1-p processing protein [Planktothrix paucivesiculata PCC 9631]
MSIEIIKGNLFTSQCQTLVNTVNCVGVMGAGIALEFRLRYPEMYTRYVELCEKQLFEIGKLWLYKSQQHWILNFPTKKHWKNPSEIEFLKLGLQKFVNIYEEKKITSIAFPVLGANNGGIPQEKSLEIMEEYLIQCNLPIQIYIYDPHSTDDIFPDLKSKFLSLSPQKIAKITGLKNPYLERIKQAMQDQTINNLSQLLAVKGIGINTVEKLLIILNQEDIS